MIIDVSNEVLTIIKNSITDANVLGSYPSTTPVFPCVIVEEKTNNDYTGTIDSGGVNHCDCMLEINIFSDAQNKVSVCKDIRNRIDNILAGQYKMTRVYSNPVPNFLDANIYRYVLRYEFLVDENETIYRR